MHRRAYVASIGSLAVAGLAGCTALGDVGESVFGETDYDIGMSRNAFDPETYEATVGEPVVWKNTSGADHTVTAYENAIPEDAAYFATGDFETEADARDGWERATGTRGEFNPGETFEHTFEVPGTYHYVCIPHERGGMVGTVVVSDSASE
ncbi:cupredoxin domain-containing protein [Natronoglomus mannanivorans]|uniref:Plastocyanin/azurin family copper-binding protein n=1 Tax=Natronoglomus mannanivorans TaxID=2979990 RepID=A0AAP2YYE6_9EURY|nr:plastocyanin/azurin family copper-binding protein [Halobacteria archaeon AArc-xg1-1]